MTDVLEARRRLDQTRAQAEAMVARDRARYGLAMIRAREGGRESQATIAQALRIGPQQVRAYEKAYRAWVKDHPGESLDD
jgi:hypothetical protein